MSVVCTDFGNLLLITLNTPKSSDIVTVDEAFLLVFCLRVCETRGEGPHYKLPRDVHLLMVIYSHHDNPLLIFLPINKMHRTQKLSKPLFQSSLYTIKTISQSFLVWISFNKHGLVLFV